MGRRTLLLIASILVAALGTALIWLYVQGADTRAQQDTALVPVLVSRGAAAPGAPAQSVVAAPAQVPATAAAGAITSLAQVAGQQLVNGVTPGQILLANMFSPQSASGVGDDKVFVSITIADPHRVPVLLQPKDRVAIYAIVNAAAGGANGKSLQRVMAEATVASVGPNTKAGPNGTTVPLQNVGFEVSPDDATRLIDIETYGQPVLALLGKNVKGAEPRG